MFDKSDHLFPAKRHHVFLGHCGVSPLYAEAARRQCAMAERHMLHGGLALTEYGEILDGLRHSAAALLRTSPDNLAFVKNTSEALSMAANGYPFTPGDEIVSYVHEYPANHYPWRLQERRGAKLVLLPDRNTSLLSEQISHGRPRGWTMEDLDKSVTPRTRIVAISHVQFTSGFAADLKELGAFCRSRGIDLVVDAAQSLGCLPLFPDEWNISAVASSGWHWLLGPVRTRIIYPSEGFREKLDHVMVGAETMVQGMDYLNHSWQPHRSAKRFEYGTSPLSLATALAACLSEIFTRYEPAAIRDEVFRLQNVFLGALDTERFTPLLWKEAHRSGILSLICPDDADDADAVMKHLAGSNIICAARGGYLRVAPHFCNTEEEMKAAAEALNRL